MAGGNIPPALLPVFQAAGHAANIPASVLAGIASVESNLGQNIGPSSTGAYGMMQFEPSTAQGLGVNVHDPRSEIFGAARLLNQYGYQQNPARAIGAYNGGPGNPQYGYARQVLAESQRLSKEIRGAGSTPMAALHPNGVGTTGSVQVPGAQPFQAQPSGPSPLTIAATFFKDSTNPFGNTNGGLGSAVESAAANQAANPVQNMVLSAQNGLQKLAGSVPLDPHPLVAQAYQKAGAMPYRGYVNPIPGATLGRTDQGVDANLPVGAPIRAIGNARVMGVLPNWYQGQPLVYYQLLDGPHAGQFVYVAEQITGLAKPGTVVRAGQPIAYYAPSGTGIETGWADAHGNTLAHDQSGYTEGQVTPAGSSFRNFLGKL